MAGTNTHAKNIFKNILIVILWPLAAMLLSSAYILLLTEAFIGPNYPGASLIGSLSFALISAGFIAIYAKLDMRRVSVFFLLAAPSLACFFVGILLYPDMTIRPLISSLGSVYPFLAWSSLKYQKTDPVSFLWEKIGPYAGYFFKKKKTRIAIAAYIFWIFLLLLTNNFEFSDVLDFEYYDERRTLVLTIMPLLLGPIALGLYKWCKHGE